MPQEIVFSEEDKIEIVNLYNKNILLKEIAQKYKISVSCLIGKLNKWGIKLNGMKRYSKVIRSNIDVYKAYEDYLELKDVVKVANKYGCCDETLLKEFKKIGKKTYRKILEEFLEKNKKEIIALYNEGVSGWEIASKFRVKGQTLYLFLNRNGIDVKNAKHEKTRTLLENNKELIYKLYFEDHSNLKQIGERFGLHAPSIGDAFKKWGWKARVSVANIMSSTEKEMANMLKCLNLEYETQFQIKKKRFDFKLKNHPILIEVNGDYWHGNPKFHQELNRVQMEAKKRDYEKFILGQKHGCKVLFFWENEINNNKDWVKEKILCKLN